VIALAELRILLTVDKPALSSTSSAPIPSNFPPTGLSYLKLAFGGSTTGGETGVQIRGQIVGLEKEIGMWSEWSRKLREDMRGLTEGKKSEQKVG